MKRHEALVPLSRQHHQMLILAQILQPNAPAYPALPTDIPGKQAYAMRVFEEIIEPQIRLEETVLFPAISGMNEDIDQLVYILKDDHCEIEQFIRTIQGDAQATNVMTQLSDLLIRHVRMEERELFELIQQYATDELWVKLSTLKTGSGS
jgi:iron-sulfur cluster repair protein YtfE (RIC family)